MLRQNPYPEIALRIRTLWLSLGWMLVVFVVYVSLTPNPVQLGVAQGDKFGHLIAYFSLMAWFSNLYYSMASRVRFAIGFIGLGVALEFVQGWTGYRTFEIADMAADAAGVVAGWTLSPPRTPNYLIFAEKLIERI